MSDKNATRKQFLIGTAVVAGIAGATAAGITPRAHAQARASKPREIVVVGSKVKEVIREAGLRSDAAFEQAVSDKVHELLGNAVMRCKGNNRGTVRPYDL